MSLKAGDFFSLEGFEHRKLFEGTEYAWEALERLEEYLAGLKLGKIEVEIPEGVILVNRELISIGKGAVVEPGAYIQGPCVIGEGAQVRFGAYIRGFVVAGRCAVIGHATEVKHSIFLNEATAGHFNYVGDSILGNRVNLGAGVKCANLRLNHKPISIIHEGKVIQTKLKKLGAIIGDDAQLGCNAVTNPGTLIGPKSFCYPCLNVGGILPPNTTMRNRR
jgi:NDP-sugar pyrophosphorylase family protein